MTVVASRLRAVFNKRLGRPAFTDLPRPERLGEVEILPRPPVLYEPEQLGRIRACAFGEVVREKIAELEATSFAGQPPECYRLGESIVVGGTVITASSRHLLRTMSELKSLRSELGYYESATFLNSMQGLHYFGHWLQDDCSLYELVRPAPTLLSVVRPNWPDRYIYERAFGQTWTETAFAYVGDLTLWRDLDYTIGKAGRIKGLRAKLRQAFPARNPGRIVYIGRGRHGEPRTMSNAAAFEDALRKAGVHVLEPGQGSEALIDALLDAELVIAIEGSQACHGLYALAEGGSFLILQPPERFYNPLREWAGMLSLRYGFVVGEKDDVSFHVDPSEVLRMVDRLLAVPSSTFGQR